MKVLIMIILSASVLLGQLTNKNLEYKFEKEVLKEIISVINEKSSGNKTDTEISKQFKNKYTALDKNLRVLCRVRVNSLSVKSKIVDLGCEIKHETHNDLFVWIPYNKIEELASLEEVLSIGSKGVFRSNTEVTSAGIGLHRTDLVYSTYGLTGNGVKVGVISDGMNHWQASSTNGDLPTFVYAVDNTNNSTNYPGSEGTAMMEIIHDIAPGAELWFGGINEQDDYLDFVDRVAHLKEQGCKVIVDDLSWLIGYSYFEENEISTAIRQFIINNTGCYISSCGNFNDVMYTGTNYTVDTDNFIKFNGSTKELSFTANYTGQIQVTFQWADNWFTPEDDFDLYVNDNNNQQVLASEQRSSSYPPEEYGSFSVTEGSTYKIKVKWYDYTQGLSNREIKILLTGDDIDMPLASSDKQIFGHPITNEVIATAATDVTDPLNVEDFSSRGPALVYSSGSGTITSVYQPKITAADGVETFVGQSGDFSNPFSGTSAAAPHVAGIAALYYEAFPNDGYSNFLQKIKNTSVTMNDGGSSSTWKKGSGYGRVDAYSAIEARIAENYVNITINQHNSQGVNVGTADVWKSTSWENFAVPKTYIFVKNSTQVLRSNQSIINNEKYHDWNSSLNDVTNHKSFTIPTQPASYTANLVPTYNVQIKNELEGTSTTGGNVGFKDPWLIDDSDSKGPKNRGTVTSALWYDNLTSPLSLSTLSNYKGVFLNQNPAQTPTYYSVRVPSQQTIDIGGTDHTFYFQNWNASPAGDAEFQYPNSTETAVVFKNANVTVNAKLKGTQLSGNPSAFSNNSQNKFIKADGSMYQVYESMGRLWLEKSTNDGSSWEILSGGQPVDYAGGQFPSLAHFDSGNESVVMVYLDNPGGYQVRVKVFQNGDPEFESVAGDYNYDYSVSSSSQPVAAYNYNGRLMVVWNHDGYLYYRYGQILTNSIQWYNSGPTLVTGSGTSSTRPTLAKDSGLNFYLAWQEGYSSIKYCKMDITSDNVSIVDAATISTGSGYPTNYYPNITTLSSGYPKVTWIGSPYYGSTSTKVIARSKTSGGWSSTFGQYGSYVNSPVINTAGSYDIIAWTENNGSANKLLKYGSIKSFNTTGKDIQLCNGSDLYSMYGSAFKTSTTPYSFATTNSVGSIAKEGEIVMSSGRAGILTKENVEYYFIFGDVTVDGAPINFVEIPDGLILKGLEEMNNYLYTEPFDIKDNSEFEFGLVYGVTDSTASVDKLNEVESIGFEIELIDANTKEVIGNYDSFEFQKNSVLKERGKEFKIKTDGIGNKTVSLRIKINTNVEGILTLAEVLNDNNVLPKSGIESQEISYAESLEIKDYELVQNYPNPFNPSTRIRYQIPNDGFVTLKVYDVLGKEIVTLVENVKSKGKYDVVFDASKLSSGVYLYTLDVQAAKGKNFRTSKKMLLVK